MTSSLLYLYLYSFFFFFFFFFFFLLRPSYLCRWAKEGDVAEVPAACIAHQRRLAALLHRQPVCTPDETQDKEKKKKRRKKEEEKKNKDRN